MPRYRFTSEQPLVFPDLPDGPRVLHPGDELDLPKDHPYTSHAWLEPTTTRSKPKSTPEVEH